jgi:competence CoiA-like predicted nuclease
MLYANDKLNNKITASPGLVGFCSGCNEQLIPKCGEINVHHWSHKQNSDCDTWHEPETKWHLNWKAIFPSDWCENIVRRGEIFHRADVLTDKGMVIEFQHSPISTEEIRERQAFYGNMIWLFDTRESRIEFYKTSEYRGNLYKCFRWYHPKRTLEAVRAHRLYLHTGRKILRVLMQYQNLRYVVAEEYSVSEFVDMCRQSLSSIPKAA